jgi:hypothetical protein
LGLRIIAPTARIIPRIIWGENRAQVRSEPEKTQRVTIYDADGWILRAPVSSGQTGYETPAGVYSVIATISHT